MNFTSIEGSFVPTADGTCAEGPDGIVVTAHPAAARAGADVLRAGGNAIDAACAVAFALGVCEPQMSGLGGQTHGIVHVDGKTMAIDGSSRAPALARPSAVGPADQKLGYRAATVPSTPATLWWLHERHGALPWRDVLRPAVELAAEGYAVTPLQHALQVREAPNFLSIPSRSGARYFLKDGRPYEAGERFVQLDLARCLEVLAHEGVDAFYRGELARRIDADMRENDGLLRADDLARVPWPRVRPPLTRRYRDVTVATMPPPGSGRTLLFTLLMLRHLQPALLCGGGNLVHHLMAEVFRKAFLQRLERPFDPDSYPEARNKRMLSAAFAHRLVTSIAGDIDPTLPIAPPGEHLEELEDETTHFCVMDRHGNIASITQSIELAYGARAAADGLGFLYNNYMAAFEREDPKHPYRLRPNAAPWSSSAPSIVSFEGRPWLALGSPGSERIFSAISQCLVHVVDGGVSIVEAVRRPRLHCSIGGVVSFEAQRFDPTLGPYLESKGYRLDPHPAFAFALGCVQAAVACRTRPGFQGVADPRRGGGAEGVAL